MIRLTPQAVFAARVWTRTTLRILVLVAMFSAALIAGKSPASRSSTSTGPIRHVVVIMEENHSFNDILGKFCAEVGDGQLIRAGVNDPCHGVTQATISDGSHRDLTIEPDSGLRVDHTVQGQRKDMNGGQMNGWDKARWCTPTSPHPYACLTQFDPMNGTCGVAGDQNCTANLDLFAEQYAMSDQTFEFRTSSSWTGHMVLATASMEHFEGDIPRKRPGDPGGAIGWGCDSGKTASWYTSGTAERRCTSPPAYRTRAGAWGRCGRATAGRGRTTSPPFWTGWTGPACPGRPLREDARQFGRRRRVGDLSNLLGVQGGSAEHQGGRPQGVPPDAAHTLPAVSFLIPGAEVSTHQPSSVSAGDNWVGQMVNAVMNGPSWSSTAIFITFDDCGCFYDDVNSLQYSPDWGPRVPMLIVSPYAKPGYTDTTPATSASMLAFIERNFALDPLHPCATEDSWDPNCTDDVQDYNGQPTYDYSDAFDFGQAPNRRVPLITTGMPPREKAWLAAHPNAGNAPT